MAVMRVEPGAGEGDRNRLRRPPHAFQLDTGRARPADRGERRAVGDHGRGEAPEAVVEQGRVETEPTGRELDAAFHRIDLRRHGDSVAEVVEEGEAVAVAEAREGPERPGDVDIAADRPRPGAATIADRRAGARKHDVVIV